MIGAKRRGPAARGMDRLLEDAHWQAGTFAHRGGQTVKQYSSMVEQSRWLPSPDTLWAWASRARTTVAASPSIRVSRPRPSPPSSQHPRRYRGAYRILLESVFSIRPFFGGSMFHTLVMSTLGLTTMLALALPSMAYAAGTGCLSAPLPTIPTPPVFSVDVQRFSGDRMHFDAWRVSCPGGGQSRSCG